ncbi:phosphotransferase family protein [Streptomyces sp. NPDC058000]|uniref:phosphotransferase family protein n=1 Tax=Streptomyces sp. NPDC058000 TaxID=3346299 RepID=UPI0036E9C5AE
MGEHHDDWSATPREPGPLQSPRPLRRGPTFLTAKRESMARSAELPERLARWILPERRRTVMRWCDWADAVPAFPGPAVLVHGDLRGDNQVWDQDELRLVVDFETVGVAEPEYDLRAIPGPGMDPGVELLTAVMRQYQQIAGRQLSPERLMAWHLRNASTTRCGATRPVSPWRIIGHHQSGWTIWPPASPRSASTLKSTPQVTSRT